MLFTSKLQWMRFSTEFIFIYLLTLTSIQINTNFGPYPIVFGLILGILKTRGGHNLVAAILACMTYSESVQEPALMGASLLLTHILLLKGTTPEIKWRSLLLNSIDHVWIGAGFFLYMQTYNVLPFEHVVLLSLLNAGMFVMISQLDCYLPKSDDFIITLLSTLPMLGIIPLLLEMPITGILWYLLSTIAISFYYRHRYK